jgi:hypothetical protein
MSCLIRFLVAAGCVAAAASAAQAQSVYLPGAIYSYDGAVISGAPPTNVLGAGPAPTGPRDYLRPGGVGYSATDVARSFYFADRDHDGDLTQTEARRLGFSISSFNEMDRNNDGVLSRSEFEDSLR